MIDPKILGRLQAGAIIRPGGTVEAKIGTATVMLKALKQVDMLAAQATLANLDDGDEAAVIQQGTRAVNDLLRIGVESIVGLRDLDGKDVKVNLANEPGTALGLEFCREIITDMTVLSTLNEGLIVKSGSPSPSSPDGHALTGAAAKASATKRGSRQTATGKTRRKNGGSDAPSARR